VVDERSQGIFSGDTFGLSYREFDTKQGPFIFPTTSPARFEPDQMHASINLLLQYQPTSIYLTHFGRVTDVARLADDLHECLDQFVTLAQKVEAHGHERHDKLLHNIENLLFTRLHAHGCTLDRDGMLAVLRPDVQLNTQGLEVWLDRKQKQQEKHC
jgi:hypothetical protein